MTLKIAYYGNPILRKKSVRVEKITEEIKQLAYEMVETMRTFNGIGIAAPQIGRSLALFVTEVPVPISGVEEEEQWAPGTVRFFINPKIISFSEETWTCSEGCLSIPKVYGNVVRPFCIVVEATDLEGKLFKEEFTGLEARCIQHEYDHINGILFLDRMGSQERTAIEPALREMKKRLAAKQKG